MPKQPTEPPISIRLPVEVRNSVAAYAAEHEIAFNRAVKELLERGLKSLGSPVESSPAHGRSENSDDAGPELAPGTSRELAESMGVPVRVVEAAEDPRIGISQGEARTLMGLPAELLTDPQRKWDAQAELDAAIAATEEVLKPHRDNVKPKAKKTTKPKPAKPTNSGPASKAVTPANMCEHRIPLSSFCGRCAGLAF